MVLLPILTKNLSINDYGIWVQIYATISLLPNIVTLGLPYTMIRFLSAEKDREKVQEGFYTIFSVVLVSTTFIFILLLLFSDIISKIIFNGNTNIAVILAIIIFFACINVFLLNTFRTLNQIKRYSVFLLIQTYLIVFLVSYFAITGIDIYYAVISILISHLITCLMMIAFLISDLGIKIPKFKHLKEYFSFGLPTIPSNLSYWIVDSSDRYIIGILLGITSVGYYAPGYTLGNIIIMLVTPFSFLLPSILPKFYEEDDIEKIMLYLKYSMKYFLLLAIPSVFGLSLLSKPILMILTTPEIAFNGYLVTPFISLSALLFGIYGIISNLIVLKKKTNILGIIWIIAAILNLTLNMILLPYYGIIGAALATLITYITASTLTSCYTRHYFKFDLDIVFIFKSLIASILMSIIIVLVKPFDILNILITVIICSVFYFVLLLLFKGIEKEEMILLKKMIRE